MFKVSSFLVKQAQACLQVTPNLINLLFPHIDSKKSVTFTIFHNISYIGDKLLLLPN